MDGANPGKLRIWGSPADVVANDLAHTAVTETSLPLSGPHNPGEFAARLYSCEALNPPALTLHAPEQPEPYSLQWFLQIETQRHSRHGRWIPRLLEFAKHSGETLLGLGYGLGTDWLQYARHGANVVVCSPSPSQLALIRRNFELRGLHARFLHAAPTGLPLQSASVDVACICDLLERVADPNAVIHEMYRVLKPGGKILAATPAKYDVDFWYQKCRFWQRWLGKPRPEDNTLRFSAYRLRRLFAPFVERRIHKRHVRRFEIPHLLRWVPIPLLERLFGHILVIKAFKPLSSALPAQVLAA